MSTVGANFRTVKHWIGVHDIDISHFKPYYDRIKRSSIASKRSDEDVFCINSLVRQWILRRTFVRNSYGTYERVNCNNPGTWNGNPLVLQLDHINGNNTDDRLSNLRWLCPNCHTQTNTFGNKQRLNN